jgi:hypothetical protein
MRRTHGGLREKLSALLASCDAQKGQGFAIRQIPLGACAEPMFFTLPKTPYRSSLR